MNCVICGSVMTKISTPYTSHWGSFRCSMMVEMWECSNCDRCIFTQEEARRIQERSAALAKEALEGGRE